METIKKTKAIHGLVERLKDRVDNSQPPDLSFTDGPRSWGDWGNNSSLREPRPNQEKSEKK